MIYDRIQNLNQFGAIMVDILIGSEGYKDLCKHISIDELNVGDLKEYSTDIANFTAMRDSEETILVNAIRKPDGTLGKY